MTFQAKVLWLVPGSEHAFLKRYCQFFTSFFHRFDFLDYRDVYLGAGGAALERCIETAVQRERYDAVVYTQFPNSYGYLTPDFLQRMRRYSAVVGLGFDDEMYFDQAKFFYAACDAVITTDPEAAAALRSGGTAAYLAQLQNPSIPIAPPAADGDIPVSFIGDVTKPGRALYIKALEAAGCSVLDYGAGSRHGILSDGGVLDVFRRSQINLNFTRTNPPDWVVKQFPHRESATQIKGRPFELAALGRFCLTEWAPCVEAWFRPHEEIAVFKDEDHLVQQVKKYLQQPNLRLRIAQGGHDRYRREYVLEIQFTRIFAHVLGAQRRAPQKNSRPTDSIYLTSVGRSRGVAFLHALRRGAAFIALLQLVTPYSARGHYWRGFADAIGDTIKSTLARSVKH